MKKLKINKYQYFELKSKPSKKELKDYYEKDYFQNNRAYYKKKYNKEEKIFLNSKINQKYENINNFFKNKKDKSILDIGAGKGEFIEFFFKKKWKVTGIDYSDYGLKNNIKMIKDKIIIGDAIKEIKLLAQKNIKFDVITLNNVLEHVLDPVKLITECKKLLKNTSILSLTVPNDESIFQKFLIKNKTIKNKYWIAYPDHINYFNKQNLEFLMNKINFKIVDSISDFPIEIFLMNKGYNYIVDKKYGKHAHLSRINFEKFLTLNFTLKEINQFYRNLDFFSLGRNINIICKLK